MRSSPSWEPVAQAQAEATKPAQRAGIDHAPRVRLEPTSSRPAGYLGRKPSYDRAAFIRVCALLDRPRPPSLGAVVRAVISKQTAFRIKQDPMGAEAALVAWGL
jgi:putative DNA-invertase from lambdoid prophage Rac